MTGLDDKCLDPVRRSFLCLVDYTLLLIPARPSYYPADLSVDKRRGPTRKGIITGAGARAVTPTLPFQINGRNRGASLLPLNAWC